MSRATLISCVHCIVNNEERGGGEEKIKSVYSGLNAGHEQGEIPQTM